MPVTKLFSPRLVVSCFVFLLSFGSVAATIENPTLAKIGAESVTLEQMGGETIDRMIKVRTEEFNLKLNLLKEYLRKQLLEREAHERGISVAELLAGC